MIYWSYCFILFRCHHSSQDCISNWNSVWQYTRVRQHDEYYTISWYFVHLSLCNSSRFFIPLTTNDTCHLNYIRHIAFLDWFTQLYKKNRGKLDVSNETEPFCFLISCCLDHPDALSDCSENFVYILYQKLTPK